MPGKVSLHVEEYIAPKPRGVMFLLAGGPEAGLVRGLFYLGRDGYWQRTFPGTTRFRRLRSSGNGRIGRAEVPSGAPVER